MKLALSILVGLLLTGVAFAREASITDWRNKRPLQLLTWCIELNPRSEATTRYFLGAPDKNEEYKQAQGAYGRSELWTYDLPGNRTLEVVMIRHSPEGLTVSRVSSSTRLPDGKVFREDWHFRPDSSEREKSWRLIATPPESPSQGARLING